MARRQFKKGPAKWVSIIKLDPCSYCGDPIPGTIDHIYPWKKGLVEPCPYLGFSVNNWQNLAPSCSTCNQKKDNKILIFFLLEMINKNL